MYRSTHAYLWLTILLLAVLLLGGCALGERLCNGNSEPANQNPPATQIEPQSDTLDSGAQELDQLLEDLEKEMKNTDTNIVIP